MLQKVACHSPIVYNQLRKPAAPAAYLNNGYTEAAIGARFENGSPMIATR